MIEAQPCDSTEVAQVKYGKDRNQGLKPGMRARIDGA
jgi:hypothetical protein